METDKTMNAAAEPLQEVDVQEIMAQIRAEIQQKELDGTLIPFSEVQSSGDRWMVLPTESYNATIARGYIDTLDDWHMVALDRPLANGAKTFFKRVMRKLVRFYVQPAIDDQNAVNATAANALYQLLAGIEAQQKVIDKQGETIKGLQETVTELVSQLAETDR